MQRILYLEPEIIDSLRSRPSVDTDPELVSAVKAAIDRLDPPLGAVVTERFYEGLSTRDIATRHGVDESTVELWYYHARRQLKLMLAGFVQERWGLEINGLCKICIHPKREKIEKMLLARPEDESWGVFCRKLEILTGEKIQPPQILKAHLIHMSKDVNMKGVNDG